MLKKSQIPILLAFLFLNNTVLSARSIDIPKLDQYFQVLVDQNKFMGNISIFRDRSEIYTKSVGFADMDKNEVADKHTKYAIGSISKTFTAVMIFQAIEKNKLSLSETLDSYFPSIKNGDKITIAMLLSHRSGIHNFTADEQFREWKTRSKTQKEMVDIIARGGTDFEPDSKAAYSNSNYVLLSFILESVYHKPYSEILSDQITRPLSLDHTYFGENRDTHSYLYFDRWRVEQKTDPTITSGAGGIVSTPGDLNVFMDALFDGKLISAKSLSVMQTIKEGYGMGLFPVPFYTKQGFGHSGGVDGFHAMVIYIPEDKTSYAITSNALNYTFNDIHIAVLSSVYGIPFNIPDFRNITLTTEDLDKYTGIYSCSQLPIKLTITHKEGSLIGQGTGQSSFPLEPAALHLFKFVQGGIVLEFNPDENTMILKQGGGVFYFTKE